MLCVCVTASDSGEVVTWTVIASLICKEAGYERRSSIEEPICVKGLCAIMNVSRPRRAGSKRCTSCVTEMKRRSCDHSS